MRDFNKIHVIALPRCATVSMWDALGRLGIRLAHLGKIYGDPTREHFHAQRLIALSEQIAAGNFDLDLLRECDGLADYPACIPQVYRALDEQYPGSLFINIRRDENRHAWLQSVEQQFIGLQLVQSGRNCTSEVRRFRKVMSEFRRMTFGASDFDADAFLRAYERHQQEVRRYFSGREDVLLDISDVSLLQDHGFDLLCDSLECPKPPVPFPRRNEHSEASKRAFLDALRRGEIRSQTGIKSQGAGVRAQESGG